MITTLMEIKINHHITQTVIIIIISTVIVKVNITIMVTKITIPIPMKDMVIKLIKIMSIIITKF